MAHTFTCLRFAVPVSRDGARLATGSGGLTLGRAGFAPAGRYKKFRGSIASTSPLPPIGPGRTECPILAYRQSPSFPSGHALFAAALGMYLFTHTRSAGLRGLLVFFVVMIPPARLYLGVHYPIDVLVGSAIGLGLWGLATGVSWEAFVTRLARRGWQRWHRQLLLFAMFGSVLFGVSKQALVVLLLLLPYPLMLTLAEQPMRRLAERGTAWRTSNAIGGGCGTGIIALTTAPLLSLGSLVSVPLVTAWVTTGCPLLVEKTAHRLRIFLHT